MADKGLPVIFQPGAICPTGYLCIDGMEPIKLPDDPDEPDVQNIPDDVIPPTLPDLPVDQPPVVNEPVVYPPGYDPIWDTEEIPAGASFEVRRGLLPTATPTFMVTGAEEPSTRRYSGSYGWMLPGGPHYAAVGGSFDPYNPWGGEDRVYGYGTNLTPYDERWFIGGGLLPESYGGYVENIVDGVGTISGEAGLLQPTVSDSYQIEPPRELTLWGSPFTATSDVDVFGLPEFIHPYYEWLATADSIDLDALLSEEA
tara:strand:- start:33 stop:800 length:768 start_codon:yes stop_codon:yes gene_type:complete